MKRLIAALTLFVGLSAQASWLSVWVSDTNVAVGESFDVVVTADMSAPFSFLSFQLDYDISLFEVATGFSSAFSSLVPEPFYLETQFTDFGFALYFDYDPFDGLELPVGEYEAARFTLTAKTASPEFATFSFADGIYAPVASNAAFEELDISPDPLNGSASVAVPAPATLGLFAMALFGLVGLRRKA